MRYIMGVAALAVCGCLSTVVHAAIYTQIFEGTIDQGSDASNVFGGGDLTGKAYSVTYVYDDSLGENSDIGEPYNQKFLYGGFGDGVKSPSLSTSVVVDGATYNFIDRQFSTLSYQVEDSISVISTFSRSYFPVIFTSFVVPGRYEYADYTISQTLDISGFKTGSSFKFHDTVFSSNHLLKYTQFAGGTPAVPAPEPATWTMMIAGFGAIGAAMRGRRRASATYA